MDKRYIHIYTCICILCMYIHVCIYIYVYIYIYVVEVTNISDIFLIAMKTCAGKLDLFRGCYAHLWENLQSFHVYPKDEWDFWELLATEQWKQNPYHSMTCWLVQIGIPRYWIMKKSPNILGSIIPHNHQPTRVWSFDHCSTISMEVSNQPLF